MRLVGIVLAQFFCTSVWFAGNIAYSGQVWLLSAVQMGFILGTLLFAILNIADRFRPKAVFLVCACVGALCNISSLWLPQELLWLFVARVACGVSLAGIYPVGMKIAASWYPKGLGWALGVLVGALVLGSGLPHLIRAIGWQGGPQEILWMTSALCVTGGLIQFFFVGDGPHLPKGSAFDLGVLRDIFAHPGFRASAFGYFGHMWELYAVYAHIPKVTQVFAPQTSAAWAFGFFVSGFLGCALGGRLAQTLGSRTVAMWSLRGSLLICLLSPLLFWLPSWLSLGVLMLWGALIIADSPQFASLNAQYAPKAYVGTALTIVNCLGFLLTIGSIQLLGALIPQVGIQWVFLILTIGPILGTWSLSPLTPTHQKH